MILPVISLIISVFPSQAVFKDKIHFNSRYPGSDHLPNTCNVSILSPVLQGDVMTPPTLPCVYFDLPLQTVSSNSTPEPVHDLHGAICKPQRL